MAITVLVLVFGSSILSAEVTMMTMNNVWLSQASYTRCGPEAAGAVCIRRAAVVATDDDELWYDDGDDNIPCDTAIMIMPSPLSTPPPPPPGSCGTTRSGSSR